MWAFQHGNQVPNPGPRRAPRRGGLIGVVEDGTSFHASSRGRLCPGADFWESFLNIAVAKAALLRCPMCLLRIFSIDTPPEFDKILSRGISVNGKPRSD
jgi:hypothetical protein